MSFEETPEIADSTTIGNFNPIYNKSIVFRGGNFYQIENEMPTFALLGSEGP